MMQIRTAEAAEPSSINQLNKEITQSYFNLQELASVHMFMAWLFLQRI